MFLSRSFRLEHVPEQTDFRNGVGVVTKLALTLADQIPTPIILIDGRAGSGKSSFAEELRNELFRAADAAPTLIHMDDLYPGWEGLQTGSGYLIQNILQPLSQGKPAAWQLWDWANSKRGAPEEPGNGWREFAGGNILIVEGCGSLSRQAKELANLAIWLEAPREVRRERWQKRDSGKFDEFWGLWQAQEDEFYETEKSDHLADLIVLN
jgi:uridine kinase